MATNLYAISEKIDCTVDDSVVFDRCGTPTQIYTMNTIFHILNELPKKFFVLPDFYIIFVVYELWRR